MGFQGIAAKSRIVCLSGPRGVGISVSRVWSRSCSCEGAVLATTMPLLACRRPHQRPGPGSAGSPGPTEEAEAQADLGGYPGLPDAAGHQPHLAPCQTCSTNKAQGSVSILSSDSSRQALAGRDYMGILKNTEFHKSDVKKKKDL